MSKSALWVLPRAPTSHLRPAVKKETRIKQQALNHQQHMQDKAPGAVSLSQAVLRDTNFCICCALPVLTSLPSIQTAACSVGLKRDPMPYKYFLPTLQTLRETMLSHRLLGHTIPHPPAPLGTEGLQDKLLSPMKLTGNISFKTINNCEQTTLTNICSTHIIYIKYRSYLYTSLLPPCLLSFSNSWVPNDSGGWWVKTTRPKSENSKFIAIKPLT